MGLVNVSKESDKDLVELLIKTFYGSRADFNQAFRDLSETPIEEWNNVCGKIYWGLGRLRHSKKFEEFLSEYKKRLAEENITDDQRQEIMKQKNPKYILRNWIAQSAIEKAENDDFSEVQHLYKILSQPFQEHPEAENLGYSKPPPSWSKDLVVSCSS